MATEKHYRSLLKHVIKLMEGLQINEKELPANLFEDISEKDYKKSIEKLKKHKTKFDESKKEFDQAKKSFLDEYELLRRNWRKDTMKIKRRIRNTRKSVSLHDFGL
ncbi:MAG: hypothetical protein AAF731_18425 [Bacteroidota bacterium]